MNALDDLQALATERGLSAEHSPEVLAEAAAAVADPGIDDPSLVDLTHLPFITIDEIRSKDLDQALFVEKRGKESAETKEDGYRVWYAIADPSWCVKPGTALFAEALRRGATFYLPGLVIPMLPKMLSEGTISINPDVDRRAMVFEVELDSEGAVIRTQIHRARVRSRVKTSYDAVQAYYDGRATVPGGPHPGSPPPADEAAIAASLECLREVGKLRMRRAELRDVISFRRQEIVVRLAGTEGLRFVAMADPRNAVERYNEQISLLCNIVGARFLLDGDTEDDHVQPIYRVHDPPTSESLADLSRQIDTLIRLRGLDEERWSWRRGKQSLADYLRSLPTSGPEARTAKAIHRQAMMTGGRSNFQEVPGKHFGVGADVYGRFTAPMREVVGIFIHKETWEKRHGRTETPPPPWDDDESLRKQVISAANRVRQMQRELDRETNGRVIDQLFGDDCKHDLADRPTRSATVLGISRTKVHLGLDDPPIDVKVYRHHLEGQLARAGTKTRIGQGNDGLTLQRFDTKESLCTVGDVVRVRVLCRDEKVGRWELEIDPRL